MEHEMNKILLFLLWISVIGDFLFTSAFSSNELAYFVQLHPFLAGIGVLWTTFAAIGAVLATVKFILNLHSEMSVATSN